MASEQEVFLCEMFENLDSSWVHSLVELHPTQSLEFLVEKCLEETERHEAEEKSSTFETSGSPEEPPSPSQCVEVLSLLPPTSGDFQSMGNSENPIVVEDDEDVEMAQPTKPDPPATEEKEQKIDDIQMTEERSALEELRQQVDPETRSEIDALQARLEQLQASYSYTTLSTALKTLSKMLGKIIENPDEDKFRNIKSTNAKFQAKVGHITGSRLLMERCGFSYFGESNNGLYSNHIHDPLKLISYLGVVDAFLSKLEERHNQSVEQEKRRRDSQRKSHVTQPTFHVPKARRLTADEIRAKRLAAFNTDSMTTRVPNSYSGVGPRRGKVMDLNAPNLSKELRKMDSKTKQRHRRAGKWRNTREGRKRTYNLDDIVALRKEDHDRLARGPAQVSEMDKIGQEALRLTNEYRAQFGLPALQWHQGLADIGREHSENMGEGRVPIGHDGFNERVGKYPFTSVSAAENVAMNQGVPNVAQVAVQGWIESPGHRKNLVSDQTYCGIGVYRNFQGAFFLTQLFGKAMW